MTDQPDKPLGVMQADQFCAKCAYNLYGQPVWLDGRLGVPVVRCSECGTVAAAGQAGVGQVWLNRVATLGLTLWVALLACTLAGLGFAMAMVDVGHLNIFTQYTDITLGPGRGMYVLTPRTQDLQSDYVALGSLVVLSLFFGGSAGAVASVFMWHLRRSTALLLAGTLPILAAGCVLAIWCGSSAAGLTRPWAIERVGGYVLLQMAAVLIGIRWGRALARMVITLFLPPRVRKALAVLWTVDGKDMPNADLRLPNE